MKESKAYKLSLPLPLVVPALVTPLVLGNFRLPDWLGTVVAFTFYSGIVGGVPYVVLVALLFWWGRGKSDAQFKRALLLSPILMIPRFFAFLVLTSLITLGFLDEAPAGQELLMVVVLYVSFILGLGYCYVLLVLGAVCVLKRLGVVAV